MLGPVHIVGNAIEPRENGMSLQVIKTITFLFVITLLGACGQKGDLYLPGEKPAALVSGIQPG
jgi:hypothetical protein